MITHLHVTQVGSQTGEIQVSGMECVTLREFYSQMGHKFWQVRLKSVIDTIGGDKTTIDTSMTVKGWQHLYKLVFQAESILSTTRQFIGTSHVLLEARMVSPLINADDSLSLGGQVTYDIQKSGKCLFAQVKPSISTQITREKEFGDSWLKISLTSWLSKKQGGQLIERI